MKEQGYFISIGAGKNQYPLIQTAVSMGYQVIAVDKNDRAPGFEFANIRIIESVSEYRKILNTLSQFPLHYPLMGIGTRSYGKAVYTTAFIAERLQLKYFTSESTRLFNNKRTLKEFLAREGIRTPVSWPWHNVNETNKTIQDITYPCILKPSDQHGKKGIQMIASATDLKKILKSHSPDDGSMLLENWINGDEITVSGFIDNGKFILVAISDKTTTSDAPFIETSHRLPSKHSALTGEVIIIIQNIIHSTGLTDGPLIAEFKITAEQEIYLMEFNPETGGEYLAENLIPVHYHYDYFKNLILLLTGNSYEANHLQGHSDKLTQICLFTLPGEETVFKGSVIADHSHCDIFLDMDLVAPGTAVEKANGNHSRVKVIGATSAYFKNHDEFDSYLRSIVTINPELTHAEPG